MNSEISNSALDDLVKTMNRIEKRLTEVETVLNMKKEISEEEVKAGNPPKDRR